MSDAELANHAWWAWFWTFIEHAAFVGLIVALAIEFAALKLAEPHKKALDDDKDGKIAEANARTKEAELELSKIKLPRSLTVAQQELLIEKFKPYAGQTYSLSVAIDPDPVALLPVIVKILDAAGWKNIKSQIGDIVYNFGDKHAGQGTIPRPNKASP